MKVQAMSSALRTTLTLREVRALHQLAKAGAEALGFMAPDKASEIIAALDMGVADLERRERDARSRRQAKSQRPNFPPMINLTVNGLTISATKGDWIDISPVPDTRIWSTITPERETLQCEIRRNVWRVLVLNPSPYGSLSLASDCTETDDKREVEALARRLVHGIDADLLPVADDDRPFTATVAAGTASAKDGSQHTHV